MKKLLILLALAFSHFYTIYGQEDRFDKIFEKYQGSEGITSIKIAKPMFGMLSSLNVIDEQLDKIKPLLAKIKGLKIIITDKQVTKEGSEDKNVQDKLDRINKDISYYLKNLNYNEVMAINSSRSKIKFLASEEKDGVFDDMVLSMDGGNGENVLVKLDGKLSMDDITKIVSSSETNINPITNAKNSLDVGNTFSYLNGESRNVGEFSKIEVRNGIVVNFNQGNSVSVKVIADSDKLKYIVTKVEGGILKIYVDNTVKRNLKFRNISVNVSSPKLNDIKLVSGGTFTAINTIRENNMSLDTSSGSVLKGNFEVSNITNVKNSSGSQVKVIINTKTINMKSTSGSDAILEGKANSGIIDISSGAACKAEKFSLKTLDAEATSGGILSVSVSDKLSVKASSGGIVRYNGNPEISSNISKISGGILKKID